MTRISLRLAAALCAPLVLVGCDATSPTSPDARALLRAEPELVSMTFGDLTMPAIRLTLRNEGSLPLDRIVVTTETQRANGHGTAGGGRVGRLMPGATTTVEAPLSAPSHADVVCYSFSVDYYYAVEGRAEEQTGRTGGGTCR